MVVVDVASASTELANASQRIDLTASQINPKTSRSCCRLSELLQVWYLRGEAAVVVVEALAGQSANAHVSPNLTQDLNELTGRGVCNRGSQCQLALVWKGRVWQEVRNTHRRWFVVW